MKQITFFLALIFLFSCKKTEVNRPDHVKAKIEVNGSVFLIDDKSCCGIGKYTLPIFGNEYISISGSTTSNSKVRITLPSNLQVGVYNTTEPGGGYTANYYDATTQNDYFSIAGSGTITVESITSSTIKGKFESTCYDVNSQVAEISEGSFEGDL